MANEVRATLREEPPLAVIDLEGDITMAAEEAITGAYREATSKGAVNILLNFSKVEYITSAGASIVIGLLAEARTRNQRILVTGLTAHYSRIFHMMGLTKYAPFFDSEAAARESVAG